MKKIFIIVTLIVSIVNAETKSSALFNDGWNSKYIKGDEKHINDCLKKKKLSSYCKSKLPNFKKELYSHKNPIMPFGQKKWHITPFEVMETICKDNSIKEVSFDLSNGDDASTNGYIKKEKICTSESIIKKISKKVIENQFDSNLKYIFGKKYTYIDSEKNKYIFSNTYIRISARYVNIDNLSYTIVYRFNTSKDINAKLFVKNKKLLKSYYLVDKSNKKYYGYFGLEYVGLFSEKTDSELIKLKLESLGKLLMKKYSKHPLEKGNSYGYPVYKFGVYGSGKLHVGPYSGNFSALMYEFSLYNAFENGYKDMILHLEKSNVNSLSSDSSNKL